MFTQIPVLHENLIPRPRLLTMIGNRPGVTVIEGLPGSGKTQLAAQWALAASDTGSTYWANAMGRASSESVEELFEQIATLGSGRELRIVIDNFMIPLDSSVRQVVARLLATCPGTQIVICAHWSGAPVSAAEWGKSAVALIRQEHLCATREETRGFVEHLSGGPNDALAEFMWREFRGWFLATKLAVETGGREGVLQTHQYITTDLLPSLASQGLIAFFLLARRLHGFTEELLATLLANHQVLRGLAGDMGAEELIASLIECGLLTRSHMSHTVPLWVVPQCLEQTAGTQRFASEEAARISETTTRFWLKQNETPAVTALLLRNGRDAKAWKALDSIRARAGATLFHDYPGAAVKGLYGLPVSLSRTFPQLWAISHLVTSILSGGRSQTVNKVPASSSAGAPGGPPLTGKDSCDPAVLLLSATDHIARLLQAGMAETALDEARATQLRFRQASRALMAPDRIMFFAWFEMHWAMAELHSMNREQGLTILRRAREHALQSGLDPLTASITSRLALHCVIIGHTSEAEDLSKELREITVRLPYELPEVELETELTAAGLCTDRLDSVHAQQHISRATSLSEASESWPLLALAKTQHALYFGSPRVMLDELQRLRLKVDQQIENSARSKMTIARCAADLFLSLGETVRARGVLDEMPNRHPLFLVPRARLAMLDGDLTAALSLASAGRWQASVPRRDQLELATLEAAAAMRLGKPEIARAAYLHAVEVAESMQVYTHLMLLPDDMREALDGLLEARDRRQLQRPEGARKEVYPGPKSSVALTPRELVVLKALKDEESLARVAEKLSVSVNTVKKQSVSLYRKLGVHSRSEAMAEAFRRGIAL